MAFEDELGLQGCVCSQVGFRTEYIHPFMFYRVIVLLDLYRNIVYPR